MTKLLVCLLFAAAVAAANPYIETGLSEVSVNPAHQFVELNCKPEPMPIDLSGWRILTSLSACTLTCQLPQDSYLVVDSEALAIGHIGHGKLRLNPLGDSVVVYDTTGNDVDDVRFPSYPTRDGNAPLPPPTGSIAFWNDGDSGSQGMNWYIDSTPTPGEANDNYSTIAGTLTGIGGITLDNAGVEASGRYGHDVACGLYHKTNFSIEGLGAGTYRVSADGSYNGQEYRGVYPESVTVGYSQVVSGIDLVIPLAGVAETPSAQLHPLMRVSGRALLVTGDGTAPVSVQLYNQIGSRVSVFDLGPLKGEKRIELPVTLAPGVYFARCRSGGRTAKTKLVLY
ncbi:MAG TPA: hypothetical protein VMH22_12250 [bacterium]|nr:hypothetical protein [bacterium]